MNTIFTIEPTTHGLTPIDAAVLMKKYIILLAMINHGSTAQKRIARSEIQELEQRINTHLNSSAFEIAKRNLGFSVENFNNTALPSQFTLPG